MLALAPGRVGEYLGTTGHRMGPEDAIFAGFADYFIPIVEWPGLIEMLEASGSAELIETHAKTPQESKLAHRQTTIDAHFSGESLGDIRNALSHTDHEMSAESLKLMDRNSPLSMACTVEIIHRLRGPSLTLRKALELEYRYTYRAMEHGDFLEGIRAQIIDKDRSPRWQYADQPVPTASVSKMLQPLGQDTLTFEET